MYTAVTPLRVGGVLLEPGSPVPDDLDPARVARLAARGAIKKAPKPKKLTTKEDE